MTNEKKQEFTRRISQANETELMAISLEITYCYLEEAEENIENQIELKKAYENVLGCLTHLQNEVYLGSEIGQNLFAIYQSVRKEMMRAYVKKDQMTIRRCKNIIKTLADAYYQLSEKDSGTPMMENAEILYTGLTYSGCGMNVDSSMALANRGFLA